MAQNITCAATSVKRRHQELLPESLIEQAAIDAGHRWRDRKFGPAATIHLFILQILHGNTAILHLRHLAETTLNAAAYCKARTRLPLKLFETLLEYAAGQLHSASSPLSGLRVLLADCTSSIAPDTPNLRKAFDQPANVKEGCGYPMAKVLAFFDAASGAILRPLICSLFVHEASCVWQLHPVLAAGDLLVGDRAFCSYVHLAMLSARQVFALFRVQQNQQVDFRRGRKHGGKGRPKSRWVKKLGKLDQLVEWRRPEQKPKWMSRKQYGTLPQTMLVRELKYKLEAKGQRTREVIIVTTLLDPLKYPAQKIAELYGLRWSVETHFASIKTTMRMSRLKCKTVEGVKKELLGYFIAYNLVRRVMQEAAARQSVDAERISFIDALRWLANARVGDTLVLLVLVPHRPDRHEPRVIKYLKYRYRSMAVPRSKMKKRPYLYADKPK